MYPAHMIRWDSASSKQPLPRCRALLCTDPFLDISSIPLHILEISQQMSTFALGTFHIILVPTDGSAIAMPHPLEGLHNTSIVDLARASNDVGILK